LTPEDLAAILPATDASKAFVVTRNSNGEHSVSNLEIGLGISTKRTKLASEEPNSCLLGCAAIPDARIALAFSDRMLFLNSRTHKLVAEVRQESVFAANPKSNTLSLCSELNLLLWWTEDLGLQTVCLDSYQVTSKLCNLFASSGTRASLGQSLVCFTCLPAASEVLLLSTGNSASHVTLYDLGQKKVAHTVQIQSTRSIASSQSSPPVCASARPEKASSSSSEAPTTRRSEACLSRRRSCCSLDAASRSTRPKASRVCARLWPRCVSSQAHQATRSSS